MRKKRIGWPAVLIVLAAVFILQPSSDDSKGSLTERPEAADGEMAANRSNLTKELTNDMKEETLSAAVGKVPPNGNPLISHRFGADPYALVYRDRVYLYMTADELEYDAEGQVKENQ